jgi:predicted nucleotide-binding protein
VKERVTIFVASSTPARPLATEFKKAITNGNSNLECRCWWNDLGSSGVLLPQLIEQCKAADFVAVFLTEDDILMKGRDVHRAPRDNCIFEAGLFTGALGAEPKRCFLITSAKESALPSDLRGLIWKTIQLSDDDKSALKAAADADKDTAVLSPSVTTKLKEIANQILEDTVKLKTFTKLEQDRALPSMSKQRLIERERIISVGGSIYKNSRILIIARQPLELREEFANAVQKNMSCDVRYEYVFHGSREYAENIVRLLDGLLNANTSGKSSEIRGYDANQLGSNLARIERLMDVFFISEEPGIELCIHNADLQDKAVAYLRIPFRIEQHRYLEWCCGQKAFQIRNQMLPQSIRGNHRVPLSSEFSEELTRHLEQRIVSKRHRERLAAKLGLEQRKA